MYGPPQNCKRTWRQFGLRKCIRPLVGSVTPGHDGIRPLSSLHSLSRSHRTSTDIRLGERRVDRCAISGIRQQTWLDSSAPLHFYGLVNSVANGAYRYVWFLHKTAQAMRSSLFANATTTCGCLRAISWPNQLFNPGACLVRYCNTTRAPCTNSLRR